MLNHLMGPTLARGGKDFINFICFKTQTLKKADLNLSKETQGFKGDSFINILFLLLKVI